METKSEGFYTDKIIALNFHAGNK